MNIFLLLETTAIAKLHQMIKSTKKKFRNNASMMKSSKKSKLMLKQPKDLLIMSLPKDFSRLNENLFDEKAKFFSACYVKSTISDAFVHSRTTMTT
jgi:hypothetical protein